MERRILISAITGVLLLVMLWSSHSDSGNDRIASKNSRETAFTVDNYASDLSAHTYKYPKHPERIITLWQNSVETLLALGAGEKIIAAGAISNESYLKAEWLEEYHKIPVRSRQVFSQENILLMQPDCIVGWLFDFFSKGRSIGTTDFWEQRGVNIYMNLTCLAEYMAKHTLADELAYISGLGKVVGREENAAEIINNIKLKVCKYKKYAADMQRKPRVLIVGNFTKAISIYTPRTLAGQLVNELGGVTIGQEFENVGNDEIIGYEDIILLDPEVVFLVSVPEREQAVLSAFKHNPVFKKLDCTKANRVYYIPAYTVRNPGVRVIDAIDIFAKGLYPEWEFAE